MITINKVTLVEKKDVVDFIFNNVDVSCFVVKDNDEVEVVSDIVNFVKTIDFESECTVESLESKFEYYELNNNYDMISFLNNLENLNVLLMRVDNLDVDVYFVEGFEF